MDEAVQELASRWRRLGGALIDGFIMIALLIPIMSATGVFKKVLDKVPLGIATQVALSLAAMVVFVMLNGYLLSKRGQTIGKVVVRTRIVDHADNVPNFWRLLVLRYLVLQTASLIPYIGDAVFYVSPLLIFGRSRRCLHDYIAGTRVVNA